MRLRKSSLIAGLVLLAAVAWVLSGQLGGPPERAAETPAVAAEKPLPRVRVREITARPKVRDIVVQGQTQPARTVVLRAETGGRVAEIVAAEGEPVARGAVILRLAMDDREARLREAKAKVAQRQLDFEAARRLEQRNFASRTRLAETEAMLEEARAEQAAIELDIARTTIRAPIAGTLQRRAVEIGEVVAAGGEIATILELSPLQVAADVTEREVGMVTPGAKASVRLVDGRTASGTVSYVSARAREGTRTYTVEVDVPNPDGAIPAGMTAELRLPARRVPAHLVPPSILTLDDEGRVGVKAVEDGTVRFLPARIIGDGPDGVWLGGLPERLTVITLGQDFVAAGQRVEAVPESENPT